MIGTAAAVVLAKVKPEAEDVEDDDKKIKKRREDEDRDNEWLPPTNQHGVKGGRSLLELYARTGILSTFMWISISFWQYF